MLADFIGWRLPSVRRYDGSETPLYVEVIFPLLYVEQKVGWSWLPAAFPTYFQIRDVAHRAVEFLLGLETHDLEIRRQQIDFDLAANRAAWSAKREEIQSLAWTVFARVEGLAQTPTISGEEIERAYLVVADGEEWKELTQRTSEMRARIAEMRAVAVPSVEDVAPAIAEQLDQLITLVAEQNARRATLFRTKQAEVGQIVSVTRRLAALDEDLQKNLDAQKLSAPGLDNLRDFRGRSLSYLRAANRRYASCTTRNCADHARRG